MKKRRDARMRDMDDDFVYLEHRTFASDVPLLRNCSSLRECYRVCEAFDFNSISVQALDLACRGVRDYLFGAPCVVAPFHVVAVRTSVSLDESCQPPPPPADLDGLGDFGSFGDFGDIDIESASPPSALLSHDAKPDYVMDVLVLWAIIVAVFIILTMCVYMVNQLYKEKHARMEEVERRRGQSSLSLTTSPFGPESAGGSDTGPE